MDAPDSAESSIKLPPASSIPPGLAQHPDYEILGELGRGGMGVVYLAWNRLMGRKEVLKVVSRELMDRRGVLDRFLREIRNAAQLHHPNIVTAYSAIRAGESIVFAMEYVEGHDLAELVKGNGPLPVAHACNFTYQAALGLQYAHEKGMVHRDIKPGNLILARHGKKPVVKVLDFGLAKATREGPVDKGLTHEGQMLGTPDYIAPEQSLDAQKADIRADIYSLGCTLYYLLSGGAPFQATSLYELLQAHHSIEARPLNLVRPEVPWELAAVVSKMMAKEPARRYQTPGEVAQALKPFFKAGEAGPVGSKAEISRAGPPPAVRRVPRSGPPDATNVAPAEPEPPAKKTPKSTQPEPNWRSLIEIADAEPERATVKPVAPSRGWPRPRWVWPAAAAGILLVALAIAWFVTARREPAKDAFLVLENVPVNAVVEIDGKRVAASSTVGEPLRIEITPGTHGLLVRQGDEVLLGESVTLEPGARLNRSISVKVTIEKRAPPSSSPSTVAQARAAGWISPSTRMEFVRIGPGEFTMGSPASDTEAENVEKPQHHVRISPFYLGMTEVTQEQYVKVVGTNPSHFSQTGGGIGQVFGRPTDQLPVENVSWLDAIKFCNALSKKDVLKPYYDIVGDEVSVPNKSGAGYRLPTEAEWEYACRAGTTTRYSFGDDPRELGEYAWHPSNSGGTTHPVGQKPQNAFGLYDMHGNVWEWCWDVYDGAYYARSPMDDPPGASGAAYRVFRGGCWDGLPRICRSAFRYGGSPAGRGSYLGFRLALGQSGR